MNRKTLLIFISTNLLFFTVCFAQKENNVWYFGQKAGLNFNSGAPVPLINGQLNTWEGCASVADDSTGQLLFYTDGVKVWNKNHMIMPNGNGLWGEKSSTQSALIVPKPASDSLYYIFTTDAGTSGFPHQGVMSYSLVDMSLAGGLGDVTVKNVVLFDTTSEQLTATLHKSGCSIWVLAHQWLTDAFFAYLVTDTGISTTPVVSHAGFVHNCSYFGQMKVSPDGKKLALPLPCDLSNNYYVELFDFDNETGEVSNLVALLQEHLVYGLEFSPNSKYLYTVDHNNSAAIMYKQTSQYNITLDSADIIASRVIVGETWNSTTFFGGSAQLGPDGKIYVVPTYKDSLSIIHDPDSAGLACNFEVAGMYLNGKINDHGLPNRVVTATCVQLSVALSASDTGLCEKFCIDFFDQSTNNPASWQWFFEGGDPSFSADQNPLDICYNIPGEYDVTLITTNASGNDTLLLSDYITVYPTPPFPVITQNGNTLTSSPADFYQWQLNAADIPGATNQSYTITQSGFYTVVITDLNGCVNSSSTDVLLSGIPGNVNPSSFFVMPNPSQGNFTIHFTNRETGEPYLLTVTNALGQRIFSESGRIFSENFKKEIKFNDASAGIYFLEIKSENCFLTKKIIITK